MKAARFFALGATHRTMELCDREMIAMTAGDTETFGHALQALQGLEEFVVVGTCNRLEVFGVAGEERAIDGVVDEICRLKPAAAERFRQSHLELLDEAAVRHLLDVAVGLDSQMLGETEIFGQLKRAYAVAFEKGWSGPILNRAFQKTFQAAKRARAQAGVTEGVVSPANAAVDLAHNVFGGLERAKVLLLGAGEMGLKSGRAFRSRGAASLTVANRGAERTQLAARELNAVSMTLADAAARLDEFDIVVCSTSAPSAILRDLEIAPAMKRRDGRPMFLIDLAMPRNIDPAVAGLDNVFLFNLDDLARITAENLEARRREFDRCASLLEERAASLWAQVCGRLSTGARQESDERPAIITVLPQAG